MPPNAIFPRDIRWKSYALSDHLGNIRATFSDMKLIDNMYPGFKVDLTSASSFYPFGMEIPGRTWNNGTGYRYGWGGHEKDNEVKGEGNSIATHFRLNDPRTGRWFTTDPVTHFSQSPFVSMDNNPVNLFDPNGADVFSDIGDALSSGVNWVSDRATEAYNGAKDLLTGTDDSPLGPGSNGLIDDIGDALGSVSIEIEGIVTYYPPSSNPTYFEDNPDYVPGPGYYGGNRNYFGEESNYVPPDWNAGINNLGLAIGSIGHEDGSPNYNAGGEITSYDPDYGMSVMVAPDFSGTSKWRKGKSLLQWIRSLWKGGGTKKSINITYLTKVGNYPSWSTVRTRYWNLMNGGKVPTATVQVHIRTTGEIKTIEVSKELHHINGRTGTDPHRFENLEELWPWEHQIIDPSRNTGYEFIKWVK